MPGTVLALAGWHSTWRACQSRDRIVTKGDKDSIMHRQQRTLAGIVLLGGIAVLASYLYILRFDAATQRALWGGVPGRLLPMYVTSMGLAATGYFVYTGFLLFGLRPAEARIAGRFGYGLFHAFYLLILVPSALWLPLTAAMVQQPGSMLWLAIRLVLALVGLASLGVLLALIALRPRRPAWAYWLSVAGSVAFCFQTAVLDLFVWTAFFTTQAV